MSTAFDIATAVAQELNTGFAGAFTAAVLALPGKDLAELAELQVTVTPRTLQPAQASRSLRTLDVAIDIGIQKHVGDALEQEVQDLAALAEEVLLHMWERPLTSAPAARFIAATNEPVVDHQLLHQKRVFTSVVTVTYRVSA